MDNPDSATPQEPPRYVLNPLAPFPKRWLDKNGQPITVMGDPMKGWLLARRPGAAPFAIHVSDILNTNRHPHRLGPFTVVEKAKRAAVTPAKQEQP